MIRQARRAVAGHGARAGEAMRGSRRATCGTTVRRSLYDLIASSSALQWMQPLETLFVRLASMLRPGGRLLCAGDGGGHPGGTAPPAAGDRARQGPRALRLPQPAAASAALQRAGFRMLRSAEETLQAEYASGTDFFRSIRRLGLTGGSLSTSSRPLTRGELECLVHRYQTACALPQGGVKASYAAWYFDAVWAGR